MSRTITATLRKVGGGSQVVELERGHFTHDADEKLLTFALRLDDSNFKGYILEAKHLPPPKINHLAAAITAAGSGGALGARGGAPGMAAGAGIGLILVTATEHLQKHLQAHGKKTSAGDRWVYVDTKGQECFEGPVYLS